jgi:hypothetical protein
MTISHECRPCGHFSSEAGDCPSCDAPMTMLTTLGASDDKAPCPDLDEPDPDRGKVRTPRPSRRRRETVRPR